MLLSALAAVTVSLLTGIPERVVLGQEVGIVVSQVGFAYVGAWIFDLVVNELPRRQSYRNAYAATWGDLSQVANNGEMLVGDLEFMAGIKQEEILASYKKSLSNLGRTCSKIESGDIVAHGRLLNAGETIRERVAVHDKHYGRLMPYFSPTSQQ